MKHKTTEMMIKISILSALAALVMTFQIPLPFAPAFYKIDLSEVVVLLAGFALGPVAAIFVEALKLFLFFLLNGTTSMGVGELANFLMGVAFVLPAALIYHKNKTRKQALIGLIVGTISLCITGALANYFILLPVYAYVFQTPLQVFVDMGSAINGNVTGLFSFVMIITIPFNLFKGVLSSLIVFLSYKKISPILSKTNN